MNLSRGDVVEADFPLAGRHPAVVVTREVAIPVLSSITVVLITHTRRGHPAEVALSPGPELRLDGESFANCDDLATLPKRRLVGHRGSLSAQEVRQLDRALAVALDLD